MYEIQSNSGELNHTIQCTVDHMINEWLFFVLRHSIIKINFQSIIKLIKCFVIDNIDIQIVDYEVDY